MSASVSWEDYDKIDHGFTLVYGGSGIRSQNLNLVDLCLGMRRRLLGVIIVASKLGDGVGW